VQADLAAGRDVTAIVGPPGKMQGISELWQGDIHPCLTVNAIGRLAMPEADRQINKAFNRLTGMAPGGD